MKWAKSKQEDAKRTRCWLRLTVYLEPDHFDTSLTLRISWSGSLSYNNSLIITLCQVLIMLNTFQFCFTRPHTILFSFLLPYKILLSSSHSLLFIKIYLSNLFFVWYFVLIFSGTTNTALFLINTKRKKWFLWI